MILCHNSVSLRGTLWRALWSLVLFRIYTIWMMHFKFVDNTQTEPAEEQLKFEEKLKKESEEMGCRSVGVSAEEG